MKAKAKRKFVARFERDEDGWWVVDVDGLQGCHTQARTLEQGLDRIADAIRLFIDDAACKLEIEQKIVLPAPVRKAVDRSNAERARAQQAEADAASATKEAVKAALGAGLSTRDAGALLGLTRQRVQQVASGR
jgi:predicted RNase H-like HicB family nuclease